MDFLRDQFLDSVPFSQISEEDYLPELKKLIALTNERVIKLKENTEAVSFENTALALENISEEVDSLAHIFFNLNSANTSDRMQEIAREFSKELTVLSSDINLDDAIFQRVKSLYENMNSMNLSDEQKRLVEKQYLGFSRNGALLDSEGKEQLRKLDEELSQTSLKFGENALAETKKFHLVLEKGDLAGLPESFLEAAAETAESKGEKGKWAVTFDYPSYVPFMQYSERRDLREKLYRAKSALCFNDSETSNKDVVKKIVRLRHERAKLLGFETHAAYILAERMAETPETVFSFISEIKDKATAFAQKEVNELQEFANNNGHEGELQRWDLAYFSEKLKKETLDIDDEILRPYFKLENVVDGVFSVASKLYGLTFKEDTTVDVYHEDVKAYRVHDSSENYVGLFYTDFHPRDSKRSGAWMTQFKEQFQAEGKDSRPHVAIVCNFTKPTAETPSLLTFGEVTTLFHEFGHALHGLLTKCHYRSLSGTNVFWDFVELPSQVLENWAYEAECLNMFAHHYKTNELIPAELIERIQKLRQFQEGMSTMRQLSFAYLDMRWHTEGHLAENVGQFEEESISEYDFYPKVEDSIFSTSFGHIFQGGYSAGYYSYKWAEVLDADAFESFKDEGLFNQETAKRFRENILEKGNTAHPMSLYENFKGKKPSPDALLKRGGLI